MEDDDQIFEDWGPYIDENVERVSRSGSDDWGVQEDHGDEEDENTDEAVANPQIPPDAVICIDTSVSTEGSQYYYNYVNRLVSELTDHYEHLRIISWNTNAKYILIEELESDGGTQPVSFLRLLKNIDSKYHLIVTTDGELFDREVDACANVLKDCNILSNILSFKIYFIGDINEMNLRLSDLFIDIEDKRIIINDEEPIKIMDIDVNKLTYDDLVNNDNIVASVLELIKKRPDTKENLRMQFCRLNTRILADIGKLTSIKHFYEGDDVNGCIDFVRKFNATDKIKFQRVMSKLIELCTEKDVNLYSLSHLVNTKSLRDTSVHVNNDSDVEDSEIEEENKGNGSDGEEESIASYHTEDNDDNEEVPLACDITLLKSNNPCAEIVILGNDDDKIFSDAESKSISQNPWLVMNDDTTINRIVKHVGHYTYDLITKNKMDEAYEHYSSAFTRQEIYGVFIFHRNSPNVDFDLVFKNNSRAISFVFNHNYKLPGNKSVWHVLFLYILANYHPYWKQYSKMIHEEIMNVLPRLSSFIALSPLLNPPIIDSFDACLWYIMKVSHLAFPNSTKNVLRFLEGAERLIDVYEYIYPGCDVSELRYKVKVWNAWKYLLRNRSSKKLKLEVISQYQNHEIIDGNFIFLSGESNKQSIDLKPLHTYNLYQYMLTKPTASLFEIIPFDNLNKGDVVPVKGVNDSVDQVNHLRICTTTCRPLYVCPVTKTVWKECVQKYDLKKESFFRAFVRFCEKHKRYPESAEEFLINHSNQFNYSSEADDVIVYEKNIKDCFAAVKEKFSDVMKKYSVKDFVWTYNRNCEIDNRLKNEKNCNCGVH